MQKEKHFLLSIQYFPKYKMQNIDKIVLQKNLWTGCKKIQILMSALDNFYIFPQESGNPFQVHIAKYYFRCPKSSSWMERSIRVCFVKTAS